MLFSSLIPGLIVISSFIIDEKIAKYPKRVFCVCVRVCVCVLFLNQTPEQRYCAKIGEVFNSTLQKEHNKTEQECQQAGAQYQPFKSNLLIG